MRCQKLPPTEPMPPGSKMDLPLAKAKPIGGDGDSTSVITYLRRGKNCGTTAARERSEKMREQQFCRH